MLAVTGCSLFQNKPVICTMEAKLCPDGSSVGRVPPTCEFAPCPTIKNEGTVSGKVTLSPTCPVERIPPDPQCAPKPYATQIYVLERYSPAAAAYKVIQSAADGTYSVTLPAGDYTLRPIGGQVLPRCESQDVTVKAGENLTVDLSCDSGIR